jgi:hypothetical protein
MFYLEPWRLALKPDGSLQSPTSTSLTSLWYPRIFLPTLPFCFRLGFFNQAIRAPLNVIAKRLHNFVARLFAFERVSVDPYLQLVFACVVLVFYRWVL